MPGVDATPIPVQPQGEQRPGTGSTLGDRKEGNEPSKRLVASFEVIPMFCIAPKSAGAAKVQGAIKKVLPGKK